MNEITIDQYLSSLFCCINNAHVVCQKMFDDKRILEHSCYSSHMFVVAQWQNSWSFRIRETGFRYCATLLNLWQTCFSLFIAPVHSAQNEHLAMAIDSGGYLCANNP